MKRRQRQMTARRLLVLKFTNQGFEQLLYRRNEISVFFDRAWFRRRYRRYVGFGGEAAQFLFQALGIDQSNTSFLGDYTTYTEEAHMKRAMGCLVDDLIAEDSDDKTEAV